MNTIIASTSSESHELRFPDNETIIIKLNGDVVMALGKIRPESAGEVRREWNSQAQEAYLEIAALRSRLDEYTNTRDKANACD